MSAPGSRGNLGRFWWEKSEGKVLREQIVLGLLQAEAAFFRLGQQGGQAHFQVLLVLDRLVRCGLQQVNGRKITDHLTFFSQAQGVLRALQNGMTLGAEVCNGLDQGSFPVENFLQKGKLPALGEVGGLQGLAPGLPGGGEGFVQTGQVLQLPLGVVEAGLGLCQLPVGLVIGGLGGFQVLLGGLAPGGFSSGNGVENAQGPAGFQVGDLFLSRLPGLLTGVCLGGEGFALAGERLQLLLQGLLFGGLLPKLPEVGEVGVGVRHKNSFLLWLGAKHQVGPGLPEGLVLGVCLLLLGAEAGQEGF